MTKAKESFYLLGDDGKPSQHSRREIRKGGTILGISTEDWGRIVFLLVALYTVLGLLYAGLMSASIEIRQEEWLELPSRFFGDFDKTERILVDANTADKVAKSIANDDDDDDDDDALFQKPIQFRSFNRPKGCREVKVNGDLGATSNGRRGLHCEYNDLWTIYPWIAERGADAGMPGCREAMNAESGLQGGSLLNADGTYSGNAVCLNGATTNTIPATQ